MAPINRLVPTVLLLLVAACGGESTNPAPPPAPPPPPPPPPPAPVASVAVSPDTTVLVPGGTRQFAATTLDASGNALTGRTLTWATASQTTATVSGSGLVTAVTAGVTQVQATSEGRTGTATVTVLDGAAIGPAGGVVSRPDSAIKLTVPAGALAQPTTLTITPVASPPASPRLAAGTAFDLGPNGTTFAQPVTVRLGYSPTAVVSLDVTRLRLHRYTNGAWVEVPGSTVDQAARTVTGQTTTFSIYAILAIPPAPVASVALSPDTTVLVPGGTRQFAATTLDASGNTLTGRTVTWSTASQAIATVSGSGLVTAVTAGVTQVQATSEGRTTTATVTVLDGSPIGSVGGVVSRPDSAIKLTVPAGALAQPTTLTITPVASPPVSPRLVAGTAFDLGPSGTTFAQAVTVRLGYSPAAVASLDVTRLRLHRYTNGAWVEVPGSTVDQAARTVTGQTTTFSVYAILALAPAAVATVTVNPDSADVEFRATRTLTAATLDAGGAALTGRAVTWTSSNAATASVSASGVVTANLPGTVTITASSEGVVGTARIRVVASNLDRIVDSLRAAFNLPALGGAIVTRTGGLVAAGVGGVRRWGNATPVTLNDKWHLGSNTKTMTGFLAAMAVAEGRLAWTDLMTSRYPQLAAVARPEFANVNLLQLVTMQSGIVGNPLTQPAGNFAQQRTTVDTWAVQQPPAAAVGTFYYSNISYQILAEIVGRAYGNGFEQAIRDRLWGPIGVTTGGFGPTTGAGMTDHPSGHTPAGASWTVCEACDNSWATGSGKMHMSLPDWARVIREILKADAGQSPLLSQGAARTLTTGVSSMNASQSYGYGWVVFDGNAQRVVTHDGSNNRNRSRSQVYLAAGIGYLAVTNAGDASGNGGVPNAAMGAVVTRLQQFWQTGQ